VFSLADHNYYARRRRYRSSVINFHEFARSSVELRFTERLTVTATLRSVWPVCAPRRANAHDLAWFRANLTRSAMPLRHVNPVNYPRPLDIYELFNGLSDTTRERKRERKRERERNMLANHANDPARFYRWSHDWACHGVVAVRFVAA
jgi:hypothetical protein